MIYIEWLSKNRHVEMDIIKIYRKKKDMKMLSCQNLLAILGCKNAELPTSVCDSRVWQCWAAHICLSSSDVTTLIWIYLFCNYDSINSEHRTCRCSDTWANCITFTATFIYPWRLLLIAFFNEVVSTLSGWPLQESTWLFRWSHHSFLSYRW